STGTGCRGLASGLAWNIDVSAPQLSLCSGCGFTKCPSFHCGDCSMRARRAPTARWPMGVPAAAPRRPRAATMGSKIQRATRRRGRGKERGVCCIGVFGTLRRRDEGDVVDADFGHALGLGAAVLNWRAGLELPLQADELARNRVHVREAAGEVGEL